MPADVARSDDATAADETAVCCLACGHRYSKPAGAGTIRDNPGCPECGYLGWLSASIAFSGFRGMSPRRCGADPRRRR